MPATVTIRIDPKTRDDLAASRIYPRETLDDVIRRLLTAQKQNGRKPAAQI